jgi:hypothetical protein
MKGDNASTRVHFHTIRGFGLGRPHGACSIGDDHLLDVELKPMLDLLFDPEGELEGILIRKFSGRIAGDLQTEQGRRRRWAARRS